MPCDGITKDALIMHTPASQLYISLTTFDVTTRHTCFAGCKCCCKVLVKVDRAQGAVQI